MPGQTSRVTSQGQISIPSDIRKRLGIGPGSVVEWEEVDGRIVVRRFGKYSSFDIHHAVFGKASPGRRTLADLKNGIEAHIREKHARD